MMKTLRAVLEQGLTVAVYMFIFYSWYLCNFEIGGRWLWLKCGSYNKAAIYWISVNSTIPPLLFFYYHLTLGRKTHSVLPQSSSHPNKRVILQPYHCINEKGDLQVCMKGSCKGSWKPPRTHHCSACGVCRMELDHHCLWLANCVTLANMKMFLCLLFLVPFAFITCTYPVASHLCQQLLDALKLANLDPWIHQIWWNRLYSWAFGGPIGRHFVGVTLGLSILQKKYTGSDSTSLLEVPHIRIHLMVLMGFLVSLFCAVLFIKTISQLAQGMTTLETLLPTRPGGSTPILICIPDSGYISSDGLQHTKYTVVSVPSGERLYDLGVVENLKSIWRRPLIPSKRLSYIQ